MAQRIDKGNAHYIFYASGHIAMLHGGPWTKRIELWAQWRVDSSVYLPLDSPLHRTTSENSLSAG